jgi:hypothetical protein
MGMSLLPLEKTHRFPGLVEILSQPGFSALLSIDRPRVRVPALVLEAMHLKHVPPQGRVRQHHSTNRTRRHICKIVYIFLLYLRYNCFRVRISEVNSRF